MVPKCTRARRLEQNDCGTCVIIDDHPKSHFLEERQSHLVVVEQEKGFAEKGAFERAGEVLGK